MEGLEEVLADWEEGWSLEGFYGFADVVELSLVLWLLLLTLIRRCHIAIIIRQRPLNTFLQIMRMRVRNLRDKLMQNFLIMFLLGLMLLSLSFLYVNFARFKYLTFFLIF